MKALAILGAIVSAWISGASAEPTKGNGALLWLLVAVVLGFLAWRL
jgi:hypothetical protein